MKRTAISLNRTDAQPGKMITKTAATPQLATSKVATEDAPMSSYQQSTTDVTTDTISSEYQEALWLPPIALHGLIGGAMVIGAFDEVKVTAEAAKWALPIVKLLQEGDRLASQDQFNEAIVAYKRVLEKCPTAAIALMSIGNCYAELGAKAQAREWLERANLVDPQRLRILLNLENLSGIPSPTQGPAIGTLSNPGTSAVHLAEAGRIANIAIEREDVGVLAAYAWDAASFQLVQEELDAAVREDPANPECRYLRACVTTPFGPSETGTAQIKTIAREFPDYVEACGFVAHPDHWRTPFQYPRWGVDEVTLPEAILPAQHEGLLTSVRDGCRRIVGFFRRLPHSQISNLSQNQRCAIRLAYLDTPHGPVTAAYSLIDTHPTAPYTSEILLNVAHISADETEASRAAYWLIRLLAQQTYTFVVLADPSGRVFFNRRVEFDAKTLLSVTTLAEQVSRIHTTTTLDGERWKQAQQHFIGAFSLDEVQF